GCTACGKGKETAIERRLRVICSIDFKDTPLLDVVERFREWAGVDIVVDEPALADMGGSLQRARSVKLDGIPLKQALEMVSHQVRLSCVIENEVVLLTSEAQAR